MAPMVQPMPDGLVLGSGSHKPGQGYCVMEAVAYVSGEPHSDHPACACPVIGAALCAWSPIVRPEVA